MITVDTNIIFPLFVRGQHTDSAIKLYEFDSVWVTEPFAMIELSNILSTYARSRLVTHEKALEYLELARDFLAPNFMSILNSKALEVALDYGITAYDARFLAVAETTGQLLITEDARLRRAAPKLTKSMDEALANIA